MTLKPNSLAARDAAYHFHGYTNAQRNEREGGFVVVRGQGPFVYTEDGREYFDGMAALWCSAFGFGKEQRLIDAAVRQMEKLPYYHTFTQKAPEPTVELAEKLVRLAPVPMSKAYFCNSGSEANDSVVKMVWYYNNALGRPQKKKIISRLKGYHGVTVAAASLTGLPYNHKDFDLPIANILHADCPHFYRFGLAEESEEDFATRMADNLERLILKEGPDTIAAMIAEPVQGAGGVIVPPKTYWDKVQAVLAKYDILLIADEVITGFCRTANWWGSQTFGLKPDILTMAKQLSAGAMPIAAVLINQRVYEALRDNSAKYNTFGHGITYSGHPVAAAVALEVIRLYEERKILDHVRTLAPIFREEIRHFASHPLVGECRGSGLVGAVEFVKDKISKESFESSLMVGATFIRFAHERGLILRPVGDAIAICPPMAVTAEELREMFRRFALALDDLAAWLKSDRSLH